ncbi:MAG: 5'/3'-nucleotidase SurE [Spirochaetales bacterium]|nr:5'/3'-nucleotidase SurE [Spirochaetales bacterium]
MDTRPLILISNDDGIESPGILAAAQALAPLANLIIAAPQVQQSATGRSLRAHPDAVFQPHTLAVGQESIQGWSLDATPATTVRHALQCLCQERKPDLLVSGINFGENAGSNVTASGTVGAAIQGATWGIPSLAVSLEVPQEFHYEHGEVDWSQAIKILHQAAKKFLHTPWPEDVHIIKIDIPDSVTSTTPWRACRLSRQPGWWGYVPNANPQAKAGTTIGKRGPRPGEQWCEGDDLSVLLEKREITITPLSLDMSSRVDLGEFSALFTGN